MMDFGVPGTRYSYGINIIPSTGILGWVPGIFRIVRAPGIFIIYWDEILCTMVCMYVCSVLQY